MGYSRRFAPQHDRQGFIIKLRYFIPLESHHEGAALCDILQIVSGQPINKLKKSDIKRIEHEINNHPRRMFGY